MADISKLSVGGTTYDIKDAVARASAGGSKVYTNLGIILYGNADSSNSINCTKIIYNGKEFTDATELKAATYNDTRVVLANRIYRLVINGDISSLSSSSNISLNVKLSNTQVMSIIYYYCAQTKLTKYVKFTSQSNATSIAYFSHINEEGTTLPNDLVESDLYSLYRSIEGGVIIPKIIHGKYVFAAYADKSTTTIQLDRDNLSRGDLVIIQQDKDGSSYATSRYYDNSSGNYNIYSYNGSKYVSIPTNITLICIVPNSITNPKNLIALNADVRPYASSWGSGSNMWNFIDIQTYFKCMFGSLIKTNPSTIVTLYNNGTAVTPTNKMTMYFSNGRKVAILEGSFNPNTTSFTINNSSTNSNIAFTPEYVLNGNNGTAYPVYYSEADSKYKLVTTDNNANLLFVLVGNAIL